MALKRITPEEFTAWCFAQTDKYCSLKGRGGIACHKCQLQAQLEADIKEHKVVIREIKEGLEEMFYHKLRYHSVTCTVNTDGNPKKGCLVCQWQEFWEQYQLA